MTHLTSKQTHEWTIGERTPEMDRHLQTCPLCTKEIVALEEGLKAFKDSVHQLAFREMARATSAAAVRRPITQFSWRWATAIAVSAGLAFLPLYMDKPQPLQEDQTAEDSRLLNQINARLSRAVPQPMEPLMKLMTDAKGDPQ